MHRVTQVLLLEIIVSKSLKKKAPAVTERHRVGAHPDHSIHLKRLSRVRGQIDGIERMITDKRYCPDIINQVKAACAALKAIESEIFKTHMRSCVKQVFNSADELGAERKIDEIVKMIY